MTNPKVVVLGMMSKIPVAGVIWQTLHYLEGFQRLGLDAYYVEAHARTPSMLMTRDDDDSSALAAAFIAKVLTESGLKDRWAFHALHDDARCYGMSAGALVQLYRDAALIINLHGGTQPLPEQVAPGRLVYLETDPVQPQLELFDNVQETVDFLDQHCAHFTFGENYGTPACTLPVTDRYQFRPTRQPVVLDWWQSGPAPADGRFTTIANWHQPWRNVSHQGRVYGWTKDAEFRRIINLPALTSVSLELALANCDDPDRTTLLENGWLVRAAGQLSGDIHAYRDYIQRSRGEFSVAKEQNIAFRTGWFSDRSACYLAAGRPVIMQDTGFGEILPTGRGLLSFSTIDEAVAALEAVQSDYEGHATAAGELARSHFSHDVVLGALLDDLDVSTGWRRHPTAGVGSRPMDTGLLLSPVSKRPTRLDPSTVELLGRRRRAGVYVAAPAKPVGPLRVSVIVPVHGRVELTQLCLESILTQPSPLGYELLVVDDASPDETAPYLGALARDHPSLRVVTNRERRGFAASINRGIAESEAEVVVIANNDTIMGPGWLTGLIAHLEGPDVGLVAASTAAHSRNCRVSAEYRTYGELQDLARARLAQGRRARAVTMAPLFCVALPRYVLQAVGPLDEQFEVGMFEDDDYCLRLRAAGYTLVCALDVFVHHFGEGTLGELYADSAFHQVFTANRARFESKWDREWDPSEDHDAPMYLAQVDAVRTMLAAEIPAGDVVAVVSSGDGALIALDGPEGWHLPRTSDGTYLGAHPSDDEDVIARIEATQREGARWLFLPSWSGWWLDHYQALRAYLAAAGRLVRDDELGWLYQLQPAAATASACTIISRNYLGQARVLARSYLDHHPDGRFYLLVIDGLPPGTELDDRILLVDLVDLPLDDLGDMCFKYDVVELATAVKPALLILLTERYREERVMYIDPDILITRPMAEVFDALDHADIVLTPHLNAPIPLDGQTPREQDILISGAYNLGFIALRRSAESARLLDWWRERLNDLCRVDPANGLMVDQRWIDLVPSLFPTASILRDDTYNVAYWNLHGRRIERDAEGYLCNGRPLAMFHFSGYNPQRPDAISKHQSRTDLPEGSALRELFDAYGRAVLEAGFLESKAWGYGLAKFDNGIGLHAIFRRLYDDLGSDRRRFGNPLVAGDSTSFYAWATTVDPERRNLSPFLEMAYRLRYDLQCEFPDVAGADRIDFLAWAVGQGASEFGFEPELVSGLMPATGQVDTDADMSMSAPEQDATLAVPPEPAALPGVNVCGYLRNESGIGAAARTYIRVLEHLGVPLALRDVSELSTNRSEDRSIGAFHDDHDFPVNLVCINADQHFVVMATDPDFFAGKYNIGVWFWELPSFPAEWHDRFAHYDEIWVGSSYIANTLAPVSPVPVVRILPVVGTQAAGVREKGRDLLGVDDEFVFLFTFDFNSYIERKNPMALVEAFRQAFPGDERARLVIKSVNGASNTAGLAGLEAAASGDERIILLNDYVSAGDIADLTVACDCYVSLHRAEGTGLTMAHAMAAAKPVIATGWSGNTDFMDASNSLLVRFDLVDLDRDIGPYKLGGTWADPDVGHAAALMRHVFDHPDEAAALGAAAQRSITTRFSVERVGQDAAARLRVIAERIGRPARAAPPVTPEHGGNAALMGPIRRIVAGEVTDGRPVVVVSKGDPILVDLGGHPAWHYPRNDDGAYAGYYPSDASTAIAHLEHLRHLGAGYFLVPATSSWWLRHYGDLRLHLNSRYRLAAEDASCVLYRLDPVAEQVGPADAATARLDDLAAQIEHLRATLEATGTWVEDLAPRVAATQERIAVLPGVLRDAVSVVSAALVDVERDVDGRIEGIGRGHDHLAGLVSLSGAKFDDLAGHTHSAPGRAEPGPGVQPWLETRSLAAGPPTAAVQASELDTGMEVALSAPPRAAAGLEAAALVDQRLAARPYLSSDFFSTGDPDRPMGFSRTDGHEEERAERPTFADVFRGERSFIAERQRAYLQFFRANQRVADLGSGRGEFLDLLAAAGVAAEGVEADGALVRACRRRGRVVHEQDAVAFLRDATPATFDGVFSAQFIEHVEPGQLAELLVLARRALRPGGIFIAETVNPENFEALKTFHVDLTHQRPIFPQVLVHLCWTAGFDEAWIFYPLGGGFTQRNYDVVGEYAVVAKA